MWILNPYYILEVIQIICPLTKVCALRVQLFRLEMTYASACNSRICKPTNCQLEKYASPLPGCAYDC